MSFKRKSIQEYRETLADKQGALAKVDGEFFRDIERRYEAAKANGAHAADFRRLEREVHNRMVAFHASPDFSQDALDAMYAWRGIMNNEADNRALAEGAIDKLGIPGADWAPAAGSWFNRKTSKPVAVLKPGERLQDRSDGRADVTVGEVLEGMLYGARDSRVKAALEEGTDTAGGYTVPTRLLPGFIDNLRAQSRFIQAGAMTVPLDSHENAIARVESDPVAGWRAESELVPESEPTFGATYLRPKSLAVMVKVSVELLQDSLNIADILQRVLTQSCALELDRAAFFGSGTGSQPAGLFGRDINVVSLGTNGGVIGYDQMIDAVYEMELRNAGPATAAVLHPRTVQFIRKMKDGDGNPLVVPEPIRSLPMLTTTAVPINQVQGTANNCSSILLGDYSQAMLGIRQELVIQRLNERYMDRLQVGFLAYLRADVAFAHYESFTKIVGIKPTN